MIQKILDFPWMFIGPLITLVGLCVAAWVRSKRERNSKD
jgi:cytochrome bd-type quinol oxidase subunit 2